MDAIVGTAGHIDHGKTALVKALTGTDADRLPDEKRRGITIDLGFAEMTIGDTHLGFVDVPGHERFVRNMLAGASGIDIVLLVVAADDGVMPQTREHFDICRLLGIKSGVIALTKTDLVDAETLDIAKMDVEELVAGSFLETSAIVPVSSRTAAGVEQLRAALVNAAGSVHRFDNRVTRLAIDRSFSVKGFGTVVTGTLSSGRISADAPLELMPAGRKVRARGIQTHGSSTRSAKAGQRTAVNLAGVDHHDVERGMTITEPDTLRPTQILDTEVEVLSHATRPLRSRQRVRIHLGTVELLARAQVLDEGGLIEPGGTGFVQIRLESPAVAIPGERFIIRSYSPQITIAGGIVLDAHAVRHRRRDLSAVNAFLKDVKPFLEDAAELVSIFIRRAGKAGCTVEDLVAFTGLRKDVVMRAFDGRSVRLGERYVSSEVFQDLLKDCKSATLDHHTRDPLSAGMPREKLRERYFSYLPAEIFDGVLKALKSDGAVHLTDDMISIASHRAEMSPAQMRFRDAMITALESAGLGVPRIEELTADSAVETRLSAADRSKLVRSLAEAGDIVRVNEEFYFAGTVIEKLISTLRAFADSSDERLIDVTKFKNIAGVSRKYAIPLLEYLDRIGVTRRAGEKRVIAK